MTTNLLGLRVENYKAVTLFEATFSPDGGVVTLAGMNGAGKSSALDALESLIAGRKGPTVTQPVHAGAFEARVIGTFDDIIVTRVWKNGTTALTVKSADGRKLDPAEALSRLYSHIGLDPFAFSRLTAKEQVDTLLPLIGVDPAPFDAEHDTAYGLRTVAGQRKDAMTARLSAAPLAAPGTPNVEVSAGVLLVELDTARAHNDSVDKAQAAVRYAVEAVEDTTAARDRAKAALVAAELAVVDAGDLLTGARERERIGGIPVDVTPLRDRISRVDETNAAVRAKIERAALEVETTAAVTAHKVLDDRVRKAKADKAAALAKAKMPVPKLTLDPETMTLLLDGTAFADASSGVKMRTGFIIAMALNPTLRLIIIRDASLLDDDNRRVIGQLAADNKFLTLMEVSGDGADIDGAVVVITDGAVSEVRA